LKLSLTVKLLVSILLLVLVPVAGLSFLALDGLDEIRHDVDVLYTENLEVVAEIANGTRDLAGHESYFALFYINHGSEDESSYYNGMITYETRFRQFLRDFESTLSFEQLPNMAQIIIEQDRDDLLTDQTAVYGSLEAAWGDYLDDVGETRTNLNSGLTAAAAESFQNATSNMMLMNDAMDSLTAICQDAARLMDKVVDDTIRTSILWTIIGGSAVASVIAISTTAISLRITRPIVEVTKVAKEISEGNFATRLEIKPSKDEIGELVISMNSLIDNTSVPLQRLTESARAISSGDLTVDIDVDAKGDLATLVESFKKMRKGLVDLTDQIQHASMSIRESSALLAETTRHMTEATQQVSSSMTQTSKGAQIQADKVDEMVRMLGEQTKAIYDVVQSSQNASRASEDASDVAQKGSRSAEDALQRIKGLLRNVEETAEAMNQLTLKSKEISQIVMIITNIAQQTNLLSLNAAIEAARAGEHGRGFAVVADEVRKLAEGSRKAAGQIQDLLESVEKDITDATQKMDHTRSNVSEGMRTVSDSLKSLEDIAATVEETAAMVQEISASTEEQKALTESLAKNLDEVASIATQTSSSAEEVSASTQEVAAGMEELTASAQDLADLANRLNELTKAISVIAQDVRERAESADSSEELD